MYSPHDGPHAGGDLAGCHFCRSIADDIVRRRLGVATRHWYVSAINGRSKRLIAGPFDDAGDAIAAVGPSKARVMTDYATDPRATMASFGIASSIGDPMPTLYGGAT
jgi:hypothetical protein